MRTLIALAVLSLAAIPAATAQDFAIINGRVITNTGDGVIENGTVLVRAGQIAGVSADLDLPDGLRTIDAAGGWVTPGIFAPVTQLGLIEVGAENSARDTAASSSSFSAAIDVADGFDPNSSHLAVNRLEGVTRFAVYPSTGANLIAGQGALGHTGGGYDALFDTQSFMYAEMGQSGAGTAGGSRPAAWAFLEAAFEDARGYPGRYLNNTQGEALGRTDAEAMVEVVRGRMPLVVTVNRASDILRLIRFQEDNRAVRLIIRGGAEAWMVADELADSGIPLLLDPMRNLPSSFEAIGSTLTAAQRLDAAGVTVAYTTDTADGYINARLLPQHAGNAVAHGVPWDAAFRAITLTPAEIYGVGDRYGALATGYVADIVIWDGDPLEVMSAPTHVFVNGEEADMENRQTRLRDRYADLDDETPFAYRR